MNLNAFQYDNPQMLEESKQKIDDLIKDLESKETALIVAQKKCKRRQNNSDWKRSCAQPP